MLASFASFDCCHIACCSASKDRTRNHSIDGSLCLCDGSMISTVTEPLLLPQPNISKRTIRDEPRLAGDHSGCPGKICGASILLWLSNVHRELHVSIRRQDPSCDGKLESLVHFWFSLTLAIFICVAKKAVLLLAQCSCKSHTFTLVAVTLFCLQFPLELGPLTLTL